MNDRQMQEMIYLDHAATSWRKPEAVGRRVAELFSEPTANAGRSGHAASVASARLVFETRERLALLLDVPASEDLVFTKNCTEAINLVLKGFLKDGDLVFVSPMEHNAVMRPLTRLVRDRHVTVEVLPADTWGRIDLDATRRRLRRRRPALTVVTHGSNVNGIVQDLESLRDALGDVPLLVDAAQTAGVLPLSAVKGGWDFLGASAHKGLLGPMGVGICYLNPRHDVMPLVEGGTGSRSESIEHPSARPDRYEAGTLNLHGIAGLSGALEGMEDRELLGTRKRRLALRLLEGVAEIPGVRVQSPRDGSALCISLTIDGVPPDRASARLEEEYGILTRPGLHCAPTAHRHLGTLEQGTLRLSPGWGTTGAEIETAIQAIARLVGS